MPTCSAAARALAKDGSHGISGGHIRADRHGAASLILLFVLTSWYRTYAWEDVDTSTVTTVAPLQPGEEVPGASKLYLPVALQAFRSPPAPTRTPHPATELPASGVNANCRVTMIYDAGDDGIVDVREITDYDSVGNPITGSWDYDGNGVIDAKTTWQYSDTHNPTVITFDSGVDGTIDATEEFRYNERDQVAEKTTDENADGRVDRRIEYAYDQAGMLAWIRSDRNADGTVDEITAMTYDERMRIRTWTVDINADGRWDAAARHIWNETLRIRSEYDSDNDERIDRVVSFVYDDFDLLRVEQIDDNADGSPDQRIEHRYDDSDRLVRTDHYINRHWESTTKYSFDSADRRLEVHFTHHVLAPYARRYENACP